MKIFQEKLKDNVDGNANSFFEFFILFAILVNTVVLGLETSNIANKYANVLFVIDQVCLWIFIVELIIKIIAYNKEFFKYKWNIFDLIIILISVLGSLPFFTVFRVFKVLRTVRLIKTVKSFRVFKTMKFINSLKSLQTILEALVHAIPNILWTMILLFVFYYVYAIFGTNIFAENSPELFGTLGKSIYTLFQLMIFDDFGNISRSVISSYPWAWLYFVSFALISAFVIMNVIIGIVVDAISEKAKEKKEVKLEVLLEQITSLQKNLEKLQKQISDKIENSTEIEN